MKISALTLCSHSQENERTKDLIVEQKFHRTIIGQKGEKIKEVRDKFPEVKALADPAGVVSAVPRTFVLTWF